MRRPRLPGLVRRLPLGVRIFIAAALVVFAGLIVAIELSSSEAVFRAVDAFTAVMRCVRPAILAAVLLGWPWIIPALYRRQWIDERRCRALLVGWERVAIALLTLELVLGQGMPIAGVAVYVGWLLYRRLRPARAFPDTERR